MKTMYYSVMLDNFSDIREFYKHTIIKMHINAKIIN